MLLLRVQQICTLLFLSFQLYVLFNAIAKRIILALILVINSFLFRFAVLLSRHRREYYINKEKESDRKEERRMKREGKRGIERRCRLSN